jgi:hypothetical protein
MTTSSFIKHAARERRIACCQRFVPTFSGQVRAAGKNPHLPSRNDTPLAVFE